MGEGHGAKVWGGWSTGGGGQRGAGQAQKNVHRSLVPATPKPSSRGKSWNFILDAGAGRQRGGRVDEVLEGSKPPQAGSVSANTACSPLKAKPCGSTCLLP